MVDLKYAPLEEQAITILFCIGSVRRGFQVYWTLFARINTYIDQCLQDKLIDNQILLQLKIMDNKVIEKHILWKYACQDAKDGLTDIEQHSKEIIKNSDVLCTL
jgi:hypothetical protein